MVGELADLQSHAPWDPARIGVPAVAIGGRSAASTTTRRRPPRRVLADCPSSTIDGAGHFGPNTHPDAVAAVVVDLVSRAASRR